MRHLKWLPAMLAASAVLAGCSESPQRQADEKLGKITDEARRLHNHARMLMVSPQFVNRTDKQRSPVLRKLEPDEVDVTTTLPAGDQRVPDLLARAQQRLRDGLSQFPDAAPETRAAAYLMLGQVFLAEGRYHADQAEEVRVDVGRLRADGEGLLGLIRDSALLGEFGGKLADVPKDKVAAIRGQVAGEGTNLDAKVNAVNGEIAALTKANDSLSQANETLRKQAADKRAQREVAGGKKRLQLLGEEQVFSRQIDENLGKIAANQDRVDILRVDLKFLQGEQQVVAAKLAAIDQRLKAMDQQVAELNGAAGRARSRGADLQKEFVSVAEKAVAGARDIARQEALAAAAFQSAAAAFDQAVRAGQAATPHVVATKALADISIADLCRRQLDTAARCRKVAEEAEATWKMLGGAPLPPVVADLKGLLPDEAGVRAKALDNYRAAEGSLKNVPKSDKTAWIYLGLLADAYYGHYQLDPSETVLKEAQSCVVEALAGKEDSPYLASVVELRRLIDAGGK